jgi:hypothetical protein
VRPGSTSWGGTMCIRFAGAGTLGRPQR